MDELSEMKEQYHQLKNALCSPNIITDRLIREATSRKIKSLNKQAIFYIVLGLVAIPYCTAVFLMFGLSWYFCIITDLFFLAEILYTWSSHKGLSPSLLVSSSLADVTRQVVRLKMRYARWLRFGIPFLVLWGGWFVYEIMQQAGLPQAEQTAILVGAFIGGLIGLGVGLYLYCRMQRMASELLDQLKDD